LGSTAQFQFLAPAHGRLTGRCTLDPENLRLLRAVLDGRERKVELQTQVDVLDQTGTVVCRSSFIWKLRRSLPR